VADELSPLASENLAWLQKKVGAHRVSEVMKDGADFELVLTKADGKRVYIFGKSAEDCIAQARGHVERVTRKP
jgi:hypothetical protein